METLLLGPKEVKKSVSMEKVIDAVEDAFRAHYLGESIMPPKSYIDLSEKYNGDFRAMPAFLEGSSGIKWVNSHPDNPVDHDLPTVMGVMIYNDPETAFPLAILDGTTLTRYRTGAAAAVATKYLAPKNSSTLGLVGAGVQAHTQVEGISSIVDIEKVFVYDIDEDAIEEFIEKEKEKERKYELVKGNLADISRCDIISTVTPSRSPILENVEKGTHINAVGADAPDKQELSIDILENSKIVVDDWEQCSESGEINTAISKGILNKKDIYGELGGVVAGELNIRKKRDDITIFDSTGLAVQDVSSSKVIYETAKQKNIGKSIKLVDT